jgi:hypothetical protein
MYVTLAQIMGGSMDCSTDAMPSRYSFDPHEKKGAPDIKDF